MPLGLVDAEFEHVREDGDPARRIQFLQQIEGGERGLRAAVIRVVDERRTVRARHGIEAQLGLLALEAVQYLLERQSARPCDGRRGERRVDAVPPEEGQFHANGALVGEHQAKRNAGQPLALDIRRADVVFRRQAVRGDARGGAGPHATDVFVVAIEDRMAVPRQPSDEIALVGNQRRLRAEPLGVRDAHIRDDADGRARDPDHRGDIARVVEPHFDDRDLHVRRQAEQRQGQPRDRVQVARIAQHAIAGREHRRDQLLRARLANAPCHANQRDGKERAPPRRKLLQRGERFRDGNDRQRRWIAGCNAPRQPLLAHDGARGALFCRLRDEGVTVHCATGKREKERARRDLTRIDDDGAEEEIRRQCSFLGQPPPGPGQHIVQPDHGFLCVGGTPA